MANERSSNSGDGKSSLTTYPYTVYCDGEVIDIATFDEAHELLKIFNEVYIDFRTMVVTIAD